MYKKGTKLTSRSILAFLIKKTLETNNIVFRGRDDGQERIQSAQHQDTQSGFP